MIDNRVQRTFFLTALTLLASSAFGQNRSLPDLPDDPEIKITTLPNGMTMYFAPNSHSASMLSLALVQKADSAKSHDSQALEASKRFGESGISKRPFERFLSDNGMLPGRNGYISTESGTVFSFDSLSLVRGERILDSLLLSVFRLADQSSKQGIPTASQAIVVAGDVEYGSLCTKAQLLSLVCPRTDGAVSPARYRWNGFQGGDIVSAPSSLDGAFSRVEVQWRDARISDKYIKTVLPAISEKLADEFGWLLKSRLYPVFRSNGIKAGIAFSYAGPAESCGDDVTRISVICDRKDEKTVRLLLKQELDRLFTHGISTGEYAYVRDANKFSSIRASSVSGRSNSELVGRCVSNFLLGASLATPKEHQKFAYREMPDTMAARLFNNYLHKRLEAGCVRNLSLSPVSETFSRDSVLHLLARYIPSESLKLPKDRNEYLSAGIKWLYPNGLNVVHKKLMDEELVSFCYSVKGGGQWADRENLETIEWIPADAFANFMASHGIDMKTTVTSLGVKFSGTVPADSFDLLVNILAAISRQKENGKVFSADRYKLFVCAGPLTNEHVKKTMALYATAFGDGVAATDCPDTNGGELAAEPDVTSRPNMVHVDFPVNLSSSNYALTKLARLVLRDALGRQLCGKGCTFRVRGGFEIFPREKYRLNIMAISADPAGFAPGEKVLKGQDAVLEIRACLSSLASRPLDEQAVAVYKKLSINEFKGYKLTPDYYVSAVINRYVDRKDLYSNFAGETNKITPAVLKEFFSNASF